MEIRSSPLCGVSTVSHQRVCGRMRWVSHNTFTKGREGSRATPSCLCSSRWVSTTFVAAAERLRDSERLMAFLDDTYIVHALDRVGRAWSCSTVPTSTCITARHKFGIEEDFARRSERDHQVCEGCEAWCSWMEGRPQVASHRTGVTRTRAGVPSGAGNCSVGERSSGGMAHSTDVWIHTC